MSRPSRTRLYMACSCIDEDRQKLDDRVCSVMDQVWEITVDRPRANPFTDLCWVLDDLEWELEYVHWDQWFGVCVSRRKWNSEEHRSEVIERISIECDVVEHGLAEIIHYLISDRPEDMAYPPPDVES